MNEQMIKMLSLSPDERAHVKKMATAIQEQIGTYKKNGKGQDRPITEDHAYMVAFLTYVKEKAQRVEEVASAVDFENQEYKRIERENLGVEVRGVKFGEDGGITEAGAPEQNVLGIQITAADLDERTA